MTTAKRLNLDDIFDDDEPILTKPISIKGHDFDVLCGINQFSLSQALTGDPGATARFMTNMVAPDQRDEFAQLIGSIPNLTQDKLLELVRRMVEVASEHPTNEPSGSSMKATKRTSAPKSRARSSSARG